MRSYRQSKFNRQSRGRRRHRDRTHEDIPRDPTHRLLWACYYGDNATAREAIRSGAKIDGNKGAGVTPLINACKLGDHETIKIVLDAGADPGLAADDGMAPLHYAAQRNDAETAETLIRAGADPAAKNANGYTPVRVAQSYGNDEAAIAIQSMISLAHARKAKIIRFPGPKEQGKKKSGKQQPARPAANVGLRI